MEVTPPQWVNLNSDNYKRRILQIGEDEKGLPEKKVSIDRKPGLENQREVGEPEGPPRERSNVNYAQEVVSMIEAGVGVKADLTALKVAGETVGSLLDIFA